MSEKDGARVKEIFRVGGPGGGQNWTNRGRVWHLDGRPMHMGDMHNLHVCRAAAPGSFIGSQVPQCNNIP